MDSASEGGGLWQRISRLFSGKNMDQVEQAIIEASQDGELQAAEGSMLLSILRLDELQVQDIMIPRTDICSVEAKETIGAAIKTILASGHSRLPVHLDNRDNITGIIHAKDLLREAITPLNLEKPVSEIIRPAFFVPPTKSVLELLNELRAKKTHLAVILDEYGGTLGLVTIEDVLEQIVGEIEDEHDTPKEADIILREDHTAMLSGRAYLEDINEELGMNLVSDEVDTIGGLLSHIAGRLPRSGEDFVLGGKRFIVKEAGQKRVEKIVVQPLDYDRREKPAEV